VGPCLWGVHNDEKGYEGLNYTTQRSSDSRAFEDTQQNAGNAFGPWRNKMDGIRPGPFTNEEETVAGPGWGTSAPALRD